MKLIKIPKTCYEIKPKFCCRKIKKLYYKGILLDYEEQKLYIYEHNVGRIYLNYCPFCGQKISAVITK
jgi:hypothetical protein